MKLWLQDKMQWETENIQRRIEYIGRCNIKNKYNNIYKHSKIIIGYQIKRKVGVHNKHAKSETETKYIGYIMW